MKYRIAYKGDGTVETGKKITAELERLGGFNNYDHRGYYRDKYYSIDDDGDISCTNTLPETYTLTQLESPQKLFRLL